MELQKFQRIEIKEIIIDHGVFHPTNDFAIGSSKIEGFKEERFNKLAYYHNTELYFIFGLNKYKYFTGAFFSPGEIEKEEKHLELTWFDIKNYFSEWLDRLKREIKEPDPWEELSKQAEIIDSKVDKNFAEETFKRLPKMKQKRLSRVSIESELTLKKTRWLMKG